MQKVSYSYVNNKVVCTDTNSNEMKLKKKKKIIEFIIQFLYFLYKENGFFIKLNR